MGVADALQQLFDLVLDGIMATPGGLEYEIIQGRCAQHAPVDEMCQQCTDLLNTRELGYSVGLTEARSALAMLCAARVLLETLEIDDVGDDQVLWHVAETAADHEMEPTQALREHVLAFLARNGISECRLPVCVRRT